MRRRSYAGLILLIKTYLASLRLAVAIVCVGVSLILGAQGLGFFPDTSAVRVRARSNQCEAIAINTAAMLRLQKTRELQVVLSTIVSRDEDLLSIGLRTDAGDLQLQTEGHEQLWSKDVAAPAEVDRMHVPINVNHRSWGSVELCHKELTPPTWLALLDHPVTKLLIFFTLGGLCVYTFFAARMMGVLNGTQVVPDRVQQSLDTLAEGLLLLDERERIVMANRAFSDTTGISTDELAGRTAGDLPWICDGDSSESPFPWTNALSHRQPQTDCRMVYQLPDGRRRILSVNSAPITGTDGGRRGILTTFRDITHVEEHRAELEQMLAVLKTSRDEISRKNRALEILARQDPLTGCLNRRAFFERFDLAWKAAHERDFPLACLLIDNDHFKSVNDTYGHDVGDEVLRKVAATLQSLHRKTDLVCRFGGEEFCVLLPGCDLHDGKEKAEQIRESIEQLRFDSPAELVVTASIGVSDLSFGAREPQELINQADKCLYVAKRQGRNQVVLFQPEYDTADIEPVAR